MNCLTCEYSVIVSNGDGTYFRVCKEEYNKPVTDKDLVGDRPTWCPRQGEKEAYSRQELKEIIARSRTGNIDKITLWRLALSFRELCIEAVETTSRSIAKASNSERDTVSEKLALIYLIEGLINSVEKLEGVEEKIEKAYIHIWPG